MDRDTFGRTVRRRSTTLVPALAIAIAGVALSACSSSDDEPPPLPSSFVSSATPTPTGGTGATAASGPTSTGATGPTGITGVFPTGPTSGATGNLDRGIASFRMTGDVRADRTLRQLISAVYSPPPGGIALVWTAGGTDPSTFGIGGLSFVGTQDTRTALTLQLTVPSGDGGFETFVSFEGECSVTMSEASIDRVSGSFRCTGLRSGSVTADATGTFSASG